MIDLNVNFRKLKQFIENTYKQRTSKFQSSHN